MCTVQHLIVDSGAFIKNAPIKDIAENIYTLPEVVNEIRDRTTRERLQVLPYKLVFKEPTPEVIKLVTDFSKKTGDFLCLSATDIRLMALTYQLHKELVGEQNLRKEPKEQSVIAGRPEEDKEELGKIAGFYIPTRKHDDRSRTTSCSEDVIVDQLAAVDLTTEEKVDLMDRVNSPPECASVPVTDGASGSASMELGGVQKVVQDAMEMGPQQNADQEDDSGDDDGSEVLEEESEYISADEDLISGEEDEGFDDDDDGDDDSAWITPENVEEAKRKMGVMVQEKKHVQVACITTDFAMQNVLIQIGLNVVSVDMMLIKHAKTYILRCHGCYKTTTNMTKIFCPHCGNRTLKRVAYVLNEDGTRQIFINFKRPINTKGLNKPLPRPRGGKHANNPIVCEDQKLPHQKISTLARKKQDVFDQDYNAGGVSPFAVRDVFSRSAHLGYRPGGNAPRHRVINEMRNNSGKGRRKRMK